MASNTPNPAKTLRSTGPAIIVILIIAAALLGYYQIVYYPSVATTSVTSTGTGTGIQPDPFNVTVTIPEGAQSPSTPTSQTYLPDVATVYIGYNATVIWVNHDSTVHTVTAAPNSPDSRFNQFGPTQPFNNVWPAGSTSYPQSINFTFTVAGDYNYTCSYHAWMKGEIIVKQAPPGLPTRGSNSTASTGSGSSSSEINPGLQLEDAAMHFATSLATLTGSGIAPWSVNLSNSLFEVASVIPAVLTKIA